MRSGCLLAILAAVAVLCASAADAATRKHKRHKVHQAPVVHGVAPHGYGAYRGNGDFPAHRPPWARGSECYTDEGYGRFTPCGAGRDNGV